MTRMENCFEFIGDSDLRDRSEEIVHDYYANRHCPADLLPEIEKVSHLFLSNHNFLSQVKVLTDNTEIVILLGDGGSGKTSLLVGLSQYKCAHVSCSSFKTKEEMCKRIQIECGRAVSIFIFIRISYSKITHFYMSKTYRTSVTVPSSYRTLPCLNPLYPTRLLYLLSNQT